MAHFLIHRTALEFDSRTEFHPEDICGGHGRGTEPVSRLQAGSTVLQFSRYWNEPNWRELA